MSKEYRNPKFKWNANRSCLAVSDIRDSGFFRHWSLVIRHSDFRPLPPSGRALGQARVRLGVIRFFAEQAVHGFLKFHRWCDVEPLMRLHKDDFAGRTLEAEEERASSVKPRYQFVDHVEPVRRQVRRAQ